MRIRETMKRLVVSVAAVAAMTGGVVAVTASPTMAAGTTIDLNGDWYAFAIHPYTVTT